MVGVMEHFGTLRLGEKFRNFVELYKLMGLMKWNISIIIVVTAFIIIIIISVNCCYYM